MESFPLSKLNSELELLRSQISEKIRWFTDNADSLTKESAESRMQEIKNLQTEIQYKANEYLDLKAEYTQTSAYTQEQVDALKSKMFNEQGQ